MITSVMAAHCLSKGIRLAKLKGYGVMPVGPDWNVHAYEWQQKYVDKIKRDLVLAGQWDSRMVHAARRFLTHCGVAVLQHLTLLCTVFVPTLAIIVLRLVC